MKISLIYVGKMRSKELKHLIDVYEKRMSAFWKYQTICVAEAKLSKGSPKEFQELEWKRIQAVLPPQASLILLDEKGARWDSVTFAGELQKYQRKNTKQLCFVLGGAYGFSEANKQKFASWALSPLTFTHEMAHYLFTEQIYRAGTIIAGHPYHNL